MKDKLKSFFSYFLRIAISGGLLVLVFKLNKISPAALWSTIKSADTGYIIAAGIVFMGVNFLLLWRWCVFMKALELRVQFFSVFRWFLIGLFCNLFLPTAIGGDIVKTIGLASESSDKPKVVASVLLDRLSGFAGIVIISLLAFVLGFSLIKNRLIILAIAVMTAASLMIAAVLFSRRLFSMVSNLFARWPKAKAALLNLHEDISLLKDRKKEGFFAIGISSLCQVVTAFIFYLVARGLHQDISIIYFLIFSPLVCVVSAVPSIGGLGVREMGWAGLLATVGVAQNVSVSISLIIFLFMVIIGLIGAIVYVTTVSPRRVQHRQAGP